MDKKLITEFITKLSLSSIPPSLQEHILNHLDKISEEDFKKMLTILNDISKVETEYFKAIDEYILFYQTLAKNIKTKQIKEAQRIQEELQAELQNVT